MSAPEVPDGPIKESIDAMSHDELARAWRFAPVGDRMFQPPYGEYVRQRLQDLGGITTGQSKAMGW